MTVADTPTFGLTHVGGGEFRFEGWSEERSILLEPAPDGPVRVTVIARQGRERRQLQVANA
jgi:hypothetical protein